MGAQLPSSPEAEQSGRVLAERPIVLKLDLDAYAAAETPGCAAVDRMVVKS